MKKDSSKIALRSNTEETLNRISTSRRAPISGFVLLLLVYVGTTVIAQRITNSDRVIIYGGQPFPLRSMTGAITSIANLSVIFLAVYYKKPGYFVSLAILLAQFPVLAIALFVRHNFTSISGFSSNVFTILAVTVIFMSNLSIRQYQERLRSQAVTDRLTGLPNKFACTELMDVLIKKKEKFAAAALHLNNLKRIGNSMGQKTADALLSELAARWKTLADQHLTGTKDFITCQGDDEFTIIIRGFGSDGDIRKTLTGYMNALKEKITFDDCDYYLTGCAGYAAYPDDAADADGLLTCAHAALAEARGKGSTESIRRYLPEMIDAEGMLQTENKIRAALENGSLCFHLQPQFDISHRLSGFEALARIREADGSIVGPGAFISVAEKVGLVDEIDYTVFKKAALFFGELIRKTHTDITLSVNTSVRHLMKNDFLDEIRSVLAASGVPANQLEIEITESIMIDSMDKALQCIGEIKKMGIKIAIDDFGTGYSSLSYLNSFPADLLKVDKSFIDRMNTSDASKQYVAAIISIGHIMNFDVISEGVEQPEQLETLRSIGCDYIQGFVWGRPMPPEEAEKLVMESVRM